jgi:hypothetical protein
MGPLGGVLVPSRGVRVVDSDRRVSLVYVREVCFASVVMWTVFNVARSGE